MPPAVIYFESDFQVQAFHHRPDDEWSSPGENWDDEVVDPGRMVYMGQGQMMFLRIDEVEPGLMWPKRRKKKKKKSPQLPPSPAPAPPSPAPIDWGDWEELCQAASPPPPVPSPLPDQLPWEPVGA
jgi:hypothetical protein